MAPISQDIIDLRKWILDEYESRPTPTHPAANTREYSEVMKHFHYQDWRGQPPSYWLEARDCLPYMTEAAQDYYLPLYVLNAFDESGDWNADVGEEVEHHVYRYQGHPDSEFSHLELPPFEHPSGWLSDLYLDPSRLRRMSPFTRDAVRRYFEILRDWASARPLEDVEAKCNHFLTYAPAIWAKAGPPSS